MSGSPPEGAFPASGPIVYTAEGPVEARSALAGEHPEPRRWFHATIKKVALLAVHEGLAPSCWRGGDCCAVCGYDSLQDVPAYRPPWVLEIHSPALPGQLKAWWVPADAIRGAWHQGRFSPASALRAAGPPPQGRPHRPCACDLSPLVAEQIEAWRSG